MKKICAILLACLLLMTLFSACGQSTQESGTEESSETSSASAAVEAEDSVKKLTVGTLQSADSFDPLTCSGCHLGQNLVFDKMLNVDYETMEVLPGIVTSYEWLDDLTLQLEVTDQAYFSNGEAVTPEDVVYSMWRFVYENDQFDPEYDHIDFDNVTIEGNTITLPLLEAYPDLITSMWSDDFGYVVSKEWSESCAEEEWWDSAVGSGPYTCVANVSGSYALYELRDDYWGEAPAAQEIEVRFYSEATTMIVDFENGELDIAMNIGESNYEMYLAGELGEDVQIKEFNSYDVLSVVFPDYVEIYDDIRVRQPFARALDPVAITTAVNGDLGTVADSAVLPTMDYYVSTGVNEYDPEAAVALLEEAGYSAGDISLLMLFPEDSTNIKAGTIIQSMLAEIGVDLQIEYGSFANILPRLMSGECELSLKGTGGNTYTASDMLNVCSLQSSDLAAQVHDETYNAYVQAGDSTTDEGEREEAYANAQTYLASIYRYIPLSTYMQVSLYHDNVTEIHGLVSDNINLTQVEFVS